MSAKKKKYYVVWLGHEPGVYSDWASCQKQTAGYPGAKYKSFSTKDAAEKAYGESWEMFYSDTGKKKDSGTVVMMHHYKDTIIKNSICVDAACSGNPGKMEYRGVKTWSKEQIFKSPVYPKGTNNIGEFLAIVHALALYSEKYPELTIYTDSKIAMGWVRAKKMRSKLNREPKTEKLFRVISRAENWLKNNSYSNPILKWETKFWGEIPADFGRK